MLRYQLFPGGKKYAVTFSYDDGRVQDRRLVELFNRYNLKATFHLSDGRFDTNRFIDASEVRDLYKGHEVSCHTVNHHMASQLPPATLALEIIENRRALENLVGYPVVGMSYPYDDYNDAVLETVTASGILYCRGGADTHRFDLPADWRAWRPTVRHRNAMPDIEAFLKQIEKPQRWYGLNVLYIWGHSYEFDNDNNWELMEEICQKLSGREEIWYATNIEIYNYVTAVRSLISSVDGKSIYNPSALDVWVMADDQKVCVPAGKMVQL